MPKKFKAAFFGTPDFAAVCLKAIHELEDIEVCCVVTQPDKPAGRGKQLKSSAVKELANELGIPVLQPKSIRKNLPGFLQELDQLGKPDFAVVSVFAQILPAGLLDYFNRMCINVHPSLLPRWRGASPIHRAMLAGDTQTAVCLMQMEEDLDSGPVWSMEKTPILEDETHDMLQERLAAITVKLLQNDLLKILNKQIQAVPQSETGITYADKLTNETSKIDWSKPAGEIACLCRGLWPQPGAFTTYNGKRLKIGLAKIEVAPEMMDFSTAAGDSNEAFPGTIIRRSKDSFTVKCGSGAIVVYQLQPESKKPLSAKDFMNGNKVNPGDRLL